MCLPEKTKPIRHAHLVAAAANEECHVSEMSQRQTTFADLCRTFAFYAVSIVAAIPFVLVYPLVYVGVPVYRFGIAPYLRVQLWILKWAGGITHRIEGWENLPESPFIFASQHQATWENLYFQLLLGNPAFFAKAEIFSYPLAGTIARKNGQIKVNRSGTVDELRSTLQQGLETLKTGRNVLIYPTGTRTATSFETARHGIAVLYRKSNRPVVPIVLDSGKYWRLGTWIKHNGEIRVKILPPIHPGLSTDAFLRELHDALSECV